MRRNRCVFLAGLLFSGLSLAQNAHAQGDNPPATVPASEPAPVSDSPVTPSAPATVPAAPAPPPTPATVLTTTPNAATDTTPRPPRRGFTFELGLGVSYTHITGRTGDRYSASQFGYAPLSVSLGGFITPRFVLAARSSATNFFRRDAKDLQSNAFLGIAGQYFVSDDWFLGAGVGLGIMGKFSNIFKSNERIDYDTGLAFSGRIGYAFARNKPGKSQNVFSVFAEVIPGFYPSRTTLGSVVGLQWQLE